MERVVYLPARSCDVKVDGKGFSCFTKIAHDGWRGSRSLPRVLLPASVSFFKPRAPLVFRLPLIFHGLRTPGLSDRIKIKSYFVIESNVFAEIESNRMQIESNDLFDFRYDSI